MRKLEPETFNWVFWFRASKRNSPKLGLLWLNSHHNFVSAVFKVGNTFHPALIHPPEYLKKHETDSMTRWRVDRNEQTFQTRCFGCDLGRLKGLMSPLLAKKLLWTSKGQILHHRCGSMLQLQSFKGFYRVPAPTHTRFPHQ